MTREPDPLLRRLQAGALAWCAGSTALALVVYPGRWDLAAGIVGGGLLTAVSFLAIKSSIDALLGLAAAPRGTSVPEEGSEAADQPSPRAVAVRALVRLVGRYGLLALLAYVMIARLRLHPVGLVVGASALVASASFEAARWVGGRRPAPPGIR
jgi:hypothetical protein